jgi:hypothetical protein
MESNIGRATLPSGQPAQRPAPESGASYHWVSAKSNRGIATIATDLDSASALFIGASRSI